MRTYADVCDLQAIAQLAIAHPYADVCGRMRTYADVCDLQAIARLATAHPKYVKDLRDKEEAERSQRYQGTPRKKKTEKLPQL